MRHSSMASSSVTCASQASQYLIARSAGPGCPSDLDFQWSTFSMEAVIANAGLHVGSPEPHRATASKWRISSGEHNLLIGPHAQDFVRLDQRTAGQLLRSGSGRTPRLDAAADLKIGRASCRERVCKYVSISACAVA